MDQHAEKVLPVMKTPVERWRTQRSFLQEVRDSGRRLSLFLHEITKQVEELALVVEV
jgi:hypothetical protein